MPDFSVREPGELTVTGPYLPGSRAPVPELHVTSVAVPLGYVTFQDSVCAGSKLGFASIPFVTTPLPNVRVLACKTPRTLSRSPSLAGPRLHVSFISASASAV